ncbi:MAG: UPF0149 family protein [Burkholderiales bacterium]|nr:UPF0149 family protein [Burkholderiales bacterium]
MKLPRRNTEAELDDFAALCERLSGFEERLSPEWSDGYLSALAAGPRAVPIDEWLPKWAGEAWERAVADPEDELRSRRILHARAAVLADQLDPEAMFDAPDALRLSPLMMDWRDEDRAQAAADGVPEEDLPLLVTGADWVEGFIAATEDFAADWDAEADDEEAEYFASLLAQLSALLLPDASDELRAHVEQTYGAAGADRDRLIDEALFAVQDMRLWWVEHAPRPETRHVEKTPGRNDPCPCGSGKKFKKCHGAAA